MSDRLKLTLNTQIYKAKENVTVDTEIINEIIDASIENIELNSTPVLKIIREDRVLEVDNTPYKFTCCVYPSSRPVYFFDDEIVDRVYAFIIVIEISDHLAVLKKSCSNISDVLDKYFDLIGSDEITSTFNDDIVEYQKISLRNMTISDRALRARSYEAADLKGLLSLHAAGRSIPYFIKIRDGNRLKTISTNTGRIFEVSQRKSVEDIVLWINQQINLINNGGKNNNFLDGFAQKITLKEVIDITSPNALLIESNALSEIINSENSPVYITLKNGDPREISTQHFNKIIQSLEETFDLNQEKQIIGFENTSKIRINSKTISVISKTLSKYFIFENGHKLTLQKLINKFELFSVTFMDPSYLYFMGLCFKDSSGVSEINNIVSMLVPQDFDNTLSEKGDITTTSNSFTIDSMFNSIEMIHDNDDYIYCDDLGGEWADHITLNESTSTIAFIHSKHGKVSSSASNLHEVVGQGIKNLGNMFFNKNQFMKKYHEKFSSNYSTSQIPRTRKTTGDIDTFLSSFLSQYDLRRECILSCSFLSKADIEFEFNKLQQGQQAPGHIYQLLWILSSFAHAVKEMNIIPKIYCRM